MLKSSSTVNWYHIIRDGFKYWILRKRIKYWMIKNYTSTTHLAVFYTFFFLFYTLALQENDTFTLQKLHSVDINLKYLMHQLESPDFFLLKNPFTHIIIKHSINWRLQNICPIKTIAEENHKINVSYWIQPLFEDGRECPNPMNRQGFDQSTLSTFSIQLHIT